MRQRTVRLSAALISIFAGCGSSGGSIPSDLQPPDANGVMLAVDSAALRVPAEFSGQLQGVSGATQFPFLVLLRRPDAILTSGDVDTVLVSASPVAFEDPSSYLVAIASGTENGSFALGYPSGEIAALNPSSASAHAAARMLLDSGAAVLAGHGAALAVARFHVDSGLTITVSRNDGTVLRTGIIPDVVSLDRRAATLFGRLSLALSSSHAIALTMLSDNAYSLNTNTGEWDSIRVVPTLRRGSRRDIRRLIALADSTQTAIPLVEPSTPEASAISEGGLLVSIYLDYEVRGPSFGARAYLNITNLRTGQQCGDISIPGPVFPRRHFAISSDLEVLALQESTSRAFVPRLLQLWRFRLRPDRCEWSDSRKESSDRLLIPIDSGARRSVSNEGEGATVPFRQN